MMVVFHIFFHFLLGIVHDTCLSTKRFGKGFPASRVGVLAFSSLLQRGDQKEIFYPRYRRIYSGLENIGVSLLFIINRRLVRATRA
jgi:hypothetical protein